MFEKEADFAETKMLINCNEFMSIYEVKKFGNEYKANLVFAYKWHKRELVEDSERNPMHIAWRTRGDLLEVSE